MSDTLRDRLNIRPRGVDEAVEAAERGDPNAAPPPPRQTTERPPAKEERGAGRDFADENRAILMRQLRARLQAAQAAGNTDLVARLKERMKALEEL